MRNKTNINVFYFTLVFLILSIGKSFAQIIPKIENISSNINFYDGAIDPVWSGITKHKIVLSESYYPNPIDFSGYWKAAYNSEKQEFYVLVEINDDIVTGYDLFEETYWDADHLTIYFNLFRDQFPRRNRSNFFFNLYPFSEMYQGSVGGSAISLNNHDYLNGFDKNVDENGWFVEVMISLKDLTSTQEINYIDTIGFDVSISDNDLGYGIKKYRLAWNDPVGEIWNTPSLLGAIVLDDKSNSSFKPTCIADFIYNDFDRDNGDQLQVNFIDNTQTNDEIINWSWTFGDGDFVSRKNPIHIYNPLKANTEACMFITTNYGCNDFICKPIERTEKHTLIGNLNSTSSIGSNWQVIAFKKEGSSYEIIEYATMINSKFQFSELINGNYLFYAIPEIVDNNNFPTYFVNEDKWQNADIIPIQNSTFDVDIHLNPVSFNFTGAGSINGQLLTYQKGIPIILSGKNSGAFLYTLTGSSGTFEFNQLPFGEYMVYPEYPNLSNIGQKVVLNPENPTIENIKFSSGTVSTKSKYGNSNYQVYYSKDADAIIVNASNNNSEIVQINIYNLFGQSLYQTTTAIDNFVTIPAGNLNTKILMVTINDRNTSVSKKIVK